MTIPLPLKGAVAVITGAGSGIGRAAALSFGARGATVVVSDVLAERTDGVLKELDELGVPNFGMRVDVTDESDLIELRQECLRRFEVIDIVMNNVGVLARGKPESLPIEAWQHVFDVNLFSIARSNRVFLPTLIERGRGHLVNTASASGLLAYGYDRLPYVASKHAVVGVSEALAIYLGPLGIGVTCLCPSGVVSNIVEQITDYGEQTSPPRAPNSPIVTAEEVGELAAAAVEEGRFLVLTVPSMRDELIERSKDTDAYVRERIAEQLT